jgi:hypothetical protein
VAVKVATELLEGRHQPVSLAIQPPAIPPIAPIGGEVTGHGCQPARAGRCTTGEPLAAFPIRLMRRDDVVHAVAVTSMVPYDVKTARVHRLMDQHSG